MQLIIVLICLLASTFAVTGINFDGFIKKNHVWEARFLAILIILTLAYASSQFLLFILSYNII